MQWAEAEGLRLPRLYHKTQGNTKRMSGEGVAASRVMTTSRSNPKIGQEIALDRAKQEVRQKIKKIMSYSKK